MKQLFPYFVVIILCSCSNAAKEEQRSELLHTTSNIDTLSKSVQTISENQKPKKDCSKREDVLVPDFIKRAIEKNFPGFGVADKFDFCEEWCYFYEESRAPYFTSGDYDGDGEKEFAAIVSNADNTKALVLIMHKNQFNAVDSFEGMEKNSKFCFGLYTDLPAKTYDFITDNTFDIKTENLEVNYFEKASQTYFWAGKGYRRIHSGD